MSAKKTVRWHPSVNDNGNQIVSNPVINKSVLISKAQKESSSNNPAANIAASLSKGQPGLNQLINSGFPAAHGQPNPSYSYAIVHAGAPIAKGQPGPAVSNLGINTAAQVEAANRSAFRTGNTPRASVSARRSGGSLSQLTPRSKREVPPWVPDPPPSGVLMPPSTPRPTRLPTPDLSPIDPGEYYPADHQSYDNLARIRHPNNPLIEYMESRAHSEFMSTTHTAVAKMSSCK